MLRSINLREDAAERLYPQAERRHVEQQQVFDFAAQHARLNRRAYGDDLVRVDALVRLAAEELLDHLLDLRNSGRAADQNHFVYLVGLQPRVFKRRAARPRRPLQDVFDQLLELGAGQLHHQVLRAALVGSDKRQVDLRSPS